MQRDGLELQVQQKGSMAPRPALPRPPVGCLQLGCVPARYVVQMAWAPRAYARSLVGASPAYSTASRIASVRTGRVLHVEGRVRPTAE